MVKRYGYIATGIESRSRLIISSTPEYFTNGPAIPLIAAAATTASTAATAVGSAVASGASAVGSFLTGSTAATGIAGAKTLAAASADAITGISTASVPVASSAINAGVAASGITAASSLGAALLAKPPKVPSAPQSPNLGAEYANGQQNIRNNSAGQLGGTFLTQGKDASTPKGGKSLLGQ